MPTLKIYCFPHGIKDSGPIKKDEDIFSLANLNFSTMTSSNSPYTIVGTPFSTFTRTITLGLQYKGLKYDQIATSPHSQLASDSHPFGYLPTLIINNVDGTQIKLSESQAIARYLDRIAPEPTLQLVDGSSQLLPEKMWEFVSFTASYGKWQLL